MNVIAAFSYSSAAEHGARMNLEIIKDFFMDGDRPRINALVSLQWTPLGGDWRDRKTSAERAVELLKRLDVPVFHPHIAYHMTEEEWRSSGQGVGGSIMALTIALPELEGVIEPILVGVTKARHDGVADTLVERVTPVEERVRKIVRRVKRWLELQRKPPSERKLAFILHNNPCASVEATVGSAAHLDSLESVARILNRLKEAGYKVENPPKDGKELIETIMERKALSEFRWTTTEEIVRRGGVLASISVDEYEKWFRTLPEDARERVVEAWGEPPGEEKDGVPASMVHDGRILITGVRYGNVVVLVQPKRGCAGARCDGQVCKILHDPDVPPPHQYLATYMWLDRVFGADAIIHVGTHGNLEFLPGKGVALSGSCFPDIAIGDVPHLYIYNSDNPPEGTIAKRRSYATLVDHMQTVMTESGLYGELKELETLISEYKRAEGARAHELQHQIWEVARKVKELEGVKSFEELLERAHRLITQIYNTQIPDGMHIFGEIPRGKRKVEFIKGVLRQELRAFARKALSKGEDGAASDAEVLLRADELSRRVVEAALSGRAADEIFEELGFNVLDSNSQREIAEELYRIVKKISDVSSRVDASDEMRSLLRGFDGGYVEPGPSGLVTRKPEVLPTGRNFYSLDPERIPTKAAWEVGKRLAEKLLERYLKEEGRYPENVAMYWMCSDIMWTDGEQLSQILYLIGVEPLWEDGKVRGFRIIPLEELGRPRIDVTVRVSGITRDNFSNVIELLDEAFHEVASLNEPLELNYVRKHALEKFKR
ncbi:MAG TPA: cobaltochelatase subunit CobN, partial [Methanomicrobia archaeon]|nr:cobaltochelatase subunit CobN [Methanomicrobia archaeon]HEX59517.1 cobaltochelatase subunit CobN [Methanomicrobia archaeon]